MGYHAKLSPSSAHRWTDCTASINESEGVADEGSEAARLGTTGHQLSAECLEFGFEAQEYMGRTMGFHAGGEDWLDVLPVGTQVTHKVVVDQDLIDACQKYINFVEQQAANFGGTLYIEQRVPIGHITGEEDAGGTSDAILAGGTVLRTTDLKLGRHKVMAYDVLVPAHEDIVTGEFVPEKLRMNLQLALYLLGAMKKYPGNYTHVTATIVQPFLNRVSEFTCTVEELLELGEWLAAQAEATRTNPKYAPSGENCHFCKGRLDCEARKQAVLSTALIGFEDVDHAQPAPIRENKLGSLYAAVGMIQGWCADVIARTMGELQAGRPVMRNDGTSYKLVAGKKGPRQFDDEAAVESLFKSMRLTNDEIYTRKLISVAAAEKLSEPTKSGRKVVAPPVLTERQWAKVSQHIVQSPGNPTIAHESDPRPALAPVTDGFDEPETTDCADLF